MVFLSTRLVALFLSCLLSFACGKTVKQSGNSRLRIRNALIKELVKDSIGTTSTTIPATHTRDAATYIWASRHQEVLRLNKLRPPKLVFIGNSILHYWGGEPAAPISRGADSWDKYFKPKSVRNLGFGYDRIENVLWRVHNGELDGYNASHVVILIGTNNLSINTDEEITEGLKFLVKSVIRHQPSAKIILMGLLPRVNYEARILTLNVKISGIADSLKVQYVSASSLFLSSNQKINKKLFSDGVHPNTEGYRLLAPYIDAYLN